MRLALSLLAACFVIGPGAMNAQAALLDLTVGYPRIGGAFIQVYYDHDGDNNYGNNPQNIPGLLVVSAFTDQIGYAPGNGADANAGEFFLQAVVDNNGVPNLNHPATQFLATADPTNTSSYQTQLSSNTLSAFGFGAEDKFEFIFTQNFTGGLVPDGSQINVIIDARNVPGMSEPNFSGDFRSTIGSAGFVAIAGAPIPEPAGAALISLAALGLLRRNRRI